MSPAAVALASSRIRPVRIHVITSAGIFDPVEGYTAARDAGEASEMDKGKRDCWMSHGIQAVFTANDEGRMMMTSAAAEHDGQEKTTNTTVTIAMLSIAGSFHLRFSYHSRQWLWLPPLVVVDVTRSRVWKPYTTASFYEDFAARGVICQPESAGINERVSHLTSRPGSGECTADMEVNEGHYRCDMNITRFLACVFHSPKEYRLTGYRQRQVPQFIFHPDSASSSSAAVNIGLHPARFTRSTRMILDLTQPRNFLFPFNANGEAETVKNTRSEKLLKAEDVPSPAELRVSRVR
ncbi:hypothetical protein D9758_011367 [Tetrapyrgos nigripes]|uniref:Uncharacterized protein n=1 Tax=Tetrapyrgos nigripes TaxID=182062 RepID=A0A8H5G880_9AGAR|nr:hypothetical protein D9758_011367 [Tetrapyrgos nigripes]